MQRLIVVAGLPGTGKSTLAESQMRLGQSAILDTVATKEVIRQQ